MRRQTQDPVADLGATPLLRAFEKQDYKAFEARYKALIQNKVESGAWEDLGSKYYTELIRDVWRNMQRDADDIAHHRPLRALTPQVCEVCMDQGMFKDARGQWRHCYQNCEAVRKTLAKRYNYWQKRLSRFEMPLYYQRLTFETWNRLPDQLKVGKELAATAAFLFIANRGTPITLRDVYIETWGEIPNGAYIDDPRNSIVLHGAMGVGKTGLAAAIMHELDKLSVPVLMMRTHDILNAINEPFHAADTEDGAGKETSTQIMRHFQEVPVLIMDEFELVKPSPSDKQKVEDLLRVRMANAMPTICTTNLNQAELEAHWGGKAISVLAEKALFILLEGQPIRAGAVHA